MESKKKCVFGCDSLGAYMHRFPHPQKYSEMFVLWLSSIGDKMQEKHHMKIYNTKRVCDYHFEPEVKVSGHRLLKSAIPTIYLQGVKNSNTIKVQLEHNYCLPRMLNTNTAPVPSTSQLLHESVAPGEIPICSNILPTTSSSERFSTNTTPHPLYSDKLQLSTSKKGGEIRSTKKELKQVSQKNMFLLRQLARLRAKQKSFKSRLSKVEELCLIKNMTVPGQLLTKIQLKQAIKKPKGRRFSLEQKKMSLMIYKKSPKSYRYLSQLFSLPSAKTLKNLLQKVEIKPGLNEFVFEQLKDSAKKMFAQDRVCSLIFDEMSITPQLHYNPTTDELKGFISHSNELKFANHALVFMVKGIRKYYKQPVAYYFTNSISKIDLKNIIKEVLTKVLSTGLKVLCTVCDQSTVNVSAINSLVMDTKEIYLRKNKEWKHTMFEVNNNKIIPLYDVPHLLKGLRNNLITKNLKYVHNGETKIIKWEYFQMLYEADKSYGELRLCQKLTEEHINPEKINKMRVKLATQLFSHSVAVATEHLTGRGDLPSECRNILPFVKLIDNLFDSLNSSNLYIQNGKVFRAAVRKGSPHHMLWQQAKEMLKSMKYIKENIVDNKVSIKEVTPPSITNLLKTIEGVQELWKTVTNQYSFECLLSRNLNQDPVENFFGNVRSLGYRNVSPNVVNFESAYKTLIINNYSSPQSRFTNCEEDYNECLSNFDYILKGNVKECVSVNDDNIVIEESFFNLNVSASPGLQQREYVCGWVLKKCLEKIVKGCSKCKKDMLSNSNANNKFIQAKEYYYPKKWLCYPSKELVTCFNEVQNITQNYLQKSNKKLNLKKDIKTLCDIFVKYPFNCQRHKEYLKNFFTEKVLNVLVFSWCRCINRILSGKQSYDEGVDPIKKNAQEYYNKYKRFCKN